MLRRRYDLPLDHDASRRLLPWIVGLMAYLAALAIEHGAELNSCDADFSRFSGLRLIDPLK